MAWASLSELLVGSRQGSLGARLKILLRLWDTIQKDARSESPQPTLQRAGRHPRALRDYLSPDIDEVVLDSDDAFDRAADYMRMVMLRQRGVLSATLRIDRSFIIGH